MPIVVTKPITNPKQVSLFVEADTRMALKMDAVRWGTYVNRILEGLIAEYIAKSEAERERFVRSLDNAAA